MRTLEEMKQSRGGHCQTCGKDIMGVEEKDHTLCNDCWNKMLSHYYTSLGPLAGCDLCDEPKDHPIHKVE